MVSEMSPLVLAFIIIAGAILLLVWIYVAARLATKGVTRSLWEWKNKHKGEKL